MPLAWSGAMSLRGELIEKWENARRESQLRKQKQIQIQERLRSASNKYMATTRGVFELKYFFTAAIASSEGGVSHSAEAVRHRIKRLIDEEPPDTILSDDAIVRTLRDSGIDIARRTVAKYREALRIPSSVQRRREKQAAL